MVQIAGAKVARDALANVPHVTSERGGPIAVPSSKVTGAELDVVKDALDHPPSKTSLGGTIASLASALLVIGKILREAKKGDSFSISEFDVFLILASAVAAAVACQSYITSWRAKDPLNEKAKKYVKALIEAQQPPDRSADTSPLEGKPR